MPKVNEDMAALRSVRKILPTQGRHQQYCPDPPFWSEHLEKLAARAERELPLFERRPYVARGRARQEVRVCIE